jgi:hypothetical protein
VLLVSAAVKGQVRCVALSEEAVRGDIRSIENENAERRSGHDDI